MAESELKILYEKLVCVRVCVCVCCVCVCVCMCVCVVDHDAVAPFTRSTHLFLPLSLKRALQHRSPDEGR
jgi:hypothetical protein